MKFFQMFKDQYVERLISGLAIMNTGNVPIYCVDYNIQLY